MQYNINIFKPQQNKLNNETYNTKTDPVTSTSGNGGFGMLGVYMGKFTATCWCQWNLDIGGIALWLQ